MSGYCEGCGETGWCNCDEIKKQLFISGRTLGKDMVNYQYAMKLIKDISNKVKAYKEEQNV
jgi:hypothetical protein